MDTRAFSRGGAIFPRGRTPRSRLSMVMLSDEYLSPMLMGQRPNLSDLRLVGNTPEVRDSACPRREWSPRERYDMDEARKVSERARVNQSNLDVELPSSSQYQRSGLPCPRREWSPRERCDIDEARRVSERARANQSNLDRGTTIQF